MKKALLVCAGFFILVNCQGPLRLLSQANERDSLDPAKGQFPRWDSRKGERVVWHTRIGGYNGIAVVLRDKVLLGTNYSDPRNPLLRGKQGVMTCFSKGQGKVLWQASHPPLPDRINDMAAAFYSRPSVDGDRVYYISNRGELVCLDLNGFHDSENDAPFREETHTGLVDADVVWKLDMVRELGVYKRDAGDVCSPLPGTLVVEDLVFCVTGNGASADLGDVPRPDAPSFLAVQKTTGKVVWSSNAPGKDIVYGQWSAPVFAHIRGRPQVIFPGGDGRLYGFEPATGRLLWKLDINPPGATRRQPGALGTRDFFVAVPTIHEETLYVGLAQEPEAGPDPRRPLFAIDLRLVQDTPERAVNWRFTDKDFAGTFGSAAVADGVVYTVGGYGVLFALDLRTGRELWRSDLNAHGGDSSRLLSPAVHAGKVLVGGEDGLFVFEAGRSKKCLGVYALDGVQGAPAVDGDVVYVTTRNELWALRLDKN